MTPPLSYILILDDHPLVAKGIAHFLKSSAPELIIEIADRWTTGELLMQKVGQPSIVIADIWLADGNSLEHLPAWRKCFPEHAWLSISGDDDPKAAHKAFLAGADGFVNKQAPPEQFGVAVNALLKGERYFPEDDQSTSGRGPLTKEWPVTPAELGLTERQGQILGLLLKGFSNKRIGNMLDIAESTVKEHVTGILHRLGVRSRIEAITHLRGRRLVTGELG